MQAELGHQTQMMMAVRPSDAQLAHAIEETRKEEQMMLTQRRGRGGGRKKRSLNWRRLWRKCASRPNFQRSLRKTARSWLMVYCYLSLSG